MTEEEYFRKNYPDYCYGDRLLSPYWDLFQDGTEFGERQSEDKIKHLEESLLDVAKKSVKRIEELEKENTELKKKLEHWKSEYEKLFNEQ